MKHKYTNKLISEKSPYLLQHAHNPVNWYPWSKEAFEKAKRENKPIFLSIGYSTCHWCHVMERESFEDTEIANILNKHFISIKVDREERPDIDSIYMTVCQTLNGHGGWPLTIIMNYDQKPFFAGTYFPKNSSFNQPGLVNVLTEVYLLWSSNKSALLESGNYITEILNHTSDSSPANKINNNTLDKTFRNLIHYFDQEYGGFNDSPKFPMPSYLFFLLRYYYKTNKKEAIYMVTETLEHIYRGGTYDHIGFGLSRYSTDNQWLIPHFEKMLYDNALMSIIYVEAYQITKNNLFFDIANNIFKYVLRDLASPDGAFYSAEDADSEGIEGNFYIWSYEEIIEILGEEEGTQFCKQYNITPEGNFEGKNIPNLINSDNIYLDDQIRKKLFDHRKKRIHSHKDDKILTSWNSLMIASLAIGGRVFKNNNYIDAASKALNFIYKNLFNEKNRLLARYRDHQSSFLAYAEDYSYLIWALIELYESTYDQQYLHKAIALNEQLINFYWDYTNGGLFLYAKDGEKLLLRPKEASDGVMPSANSVATMNWIKLFKITGNKEYNRLIQKQFETFGHDINNNPTEYSYFLSAFFMTLDESNEIVIIGNKDDKKTKDMLEIINTNFLPNTTTLLKEDDIIYSLAFFNNYKKIDNNTTAYICQNKTCFHPITDIEQFKSILKIK